MPKILDTSLMLDISNRPISYLLGLWRQSLTGEKKQNVVDVERQDNEASLVLVDVHARIRLERAEDGQLHVHRAEPVLRALPKAVQSLLELHDEINYCFVVGLVARHHLDEHILFNVGVEECRLHAQHLHFVVQLCCKCEQNADAL